MSVGVQIPPTTCGFFLARVKECFEFLVSTYKVNSLIPNTFVMVLESDIVKASIVGMMVLLDLGFRSNIPRRETDDVCMEFGGIDYEGFTIEWCHRNVIIKEVRVCRSIRFRVRADNIAQRYTVTSWNPMKEVDKGWLPVCPTNLV